MDKPNKWENYFQLIEFDCNNGYQASLRMSPFEVLQGRKCHTHVSWDKPMDRIVLGPEMLKKMEHIVKEMQHNSEVSQDRQATWEMEDKMREAYPSMLWNEQGSSK